MLEVSSKLLWRGLLGVMSVAPADALRLVGVAILPFVLDLPDCTDVGCQSVRAVLRRGLRSRDNVDTVASEKIVCMLTYEALLEGLSPLSNLERMRSNQEPGTKPYSTNLHRPRRPRVIGFGLTRWQNIFAASLLRRLDDHQSGATQSRNADWTCLRPWHLSFH